MQRNKNIPEVSYIICVVIGLICRLLYCVVYPVHSRDAYFYKEIVESWINNNEIFIIEYDFIPPLPLWVFKTAHDIMDIGFFKEAISINMFLGLVTVIIIMSLAQEILKNKNSVILSGLIFATNPTLIKLSCEALREILFLVAILFSFRLYLWKKKSFRTSYVVLQGLAISIGILSRLEAIEVLIIMFIISLWKVINNKKIISKTIFELIVECLSTAIWIIVISCCLNIPIDYYIKGLKNLKI